MDHLDRLKIHLLAGNNLIIRVITKFDAAEKSLKFLHEIMHQCHQYWY
jgi:hypothetical protein